MSIRMDFSNRFENGRFEIRRRPAAEVRADGGEGEVITLAGYAAKYNTLSELMWDFREQIAPGAFDDVLGMDVRCLFNHDPNLLLGRTASGTCRLTADDVGLRYEVDLPDTEYARSLAVSVERGDVTQSSFAFWVDAGNSVWAEQPDGTWIRTITKVTELFDVSPVTYPAYPDATVSMRSQMLKTQKDALSAAKTAEQRDAAMRAAAARNRQLLLLRAA